MIDVMDTMLLSNYYLQKKGTGNREQGTGNTHLHQFRVSGKNKDVFKRCVAQKTFLFPVASVFPLKKIYLETRKICVK
jgi:hypothetical protein